MSQNLIFIFDIERLKIKLERGVLMLSKVGQRMWIFEAKEKHR